MPNLQFVSPATTPPALMYTNLILITSFLGNVMILLRPTDGIRLKC